MRLFIAGHAGGTNVGGSVWNAAGELGLTRYFSDTREAFAASRWLGAVHWWLRGRRPRHLRRFSRELVESCRWFRPDVLLCTGLAPVEAEALEQIGRLRIRRLNYLTDDPWNRAHRAKWFFRALPHYDVVFSPRRANVEDLRSAGCRDVKYLPFGFDPKLFFPEPPVNRPDGGQPGYDVLFAGGADADRVSYLAEVIRGGFRLALYGDYWERFAATRCCARGHADPVTLRKVTSAAKVALCLVRRANRDGHVMRSFEIAATGACMLVEDTAEHREIFGEDGQAVVYFRTRHDLVTRLRWLLDHEGQRKRLAEAAHQRIVGGTNTYRDRLATMLGLSDESPERGSGPLPGRSHTGVSS